MVLPFAIGAALAVAPVGHAQSAAAPAAPQAFEVASVKPSPPRSVQKGMSGSPSEIRWRGFSLKDYIFLAYGVKDYSFSGPSWLEAAAFDIDAKLPAGSQSSLFPAMLQTLLAERFKLAVHRESRAVNGFVLVVDKKGLKIQPFEPGTASRVTTYPTHLVAKSASMTQFADMLSSHLGSPVKDRTGLPGVYNFTLEWLPDDAPLTTGGPVANTVFGALEEQLGLRLETGKVPIDILVVDHIERTPTEN
jgi:uncharacterized protein (TIGR03435 family)